MGPLNAASIEDSSLQKGYQHLVQLHMLSDIELTAQACLFNSETGRDNLDALLAELDDRFGVMCTLVRGAMDMSSQASFLDCQEYS